MAKSLSRMISPVENCQFVETRSTGLNSLLEKMNLNQECITGQEINKSCTVANVESHLWLTCSEDYLGNDNLFELVLRDVKEIMNFQVDSLLVTLVCTKKMINKNITTFRGDFKITHFYRLRDFENQNCYVIVSTLKPYGITYSLENLVQRSIKLKLINDERSGSFIWHGFKYSHDSYFFQTFHQAESFMKKVASFDSKYLCDTVFTRKRDIVIQTYGMKMSIYYIYPLFPLKQSEMNSSLKSDRFLANNFEGISEQLTKIFVKTGHEPVGHQHLRFRVLKRVRTDTYFMVDYTWLSELIRIENQIRYEISDFQ